MMGTRDFVGSYFSLFLASRRGWCGRSVRRWNRTAAASSLRVARHPDGTRKHTKARSGREPIGVDEPPSIGECQALCTAGDADGMAATMIFVRQDVGTSQRIQVNSEYVQRINRVIDYFRANLHRQVKLEELAKVACFSEFHFHRIFGAVAGETLNSFANRIRLEKAVRLLRYSDHSLTNIALDCGFSSSATLSRAFRSGYETSASRFRKSGELKNRKICKELFSGDQP